MYKRIAVVMALISIAAVASEPLPYTFNLTVRIGTGMPIGVQASLPPGSNRVLDVTPSLHFDLITPPDGRSPTIVRLRDTSGAEPKVLHTAQLGGTAELTRLSLYTVCKEGVYFESPTPSVSTVKCKD
jgi:hypothetical protein